MQITVKEFDWIYLRGERSSTIRVIVECGGREFKRLFHWGYAVVWSEEGVPGFCDDKTRNELESIFKAWCLSNNKDIDNPLNQIENIKTKNQQP